MEPLTSKEYFPAPNHPIDCGLGPGTTEVRACLAESGDAQCPALATPSALPGEATKAPCSLLGTVGF